MELIRLSAGGAPLLGEPAPIEFANTTYAIRGRLCEGLDTTDHLAAWLRDMRTRLAVALTDDDLDTVTGGDLAVAHDLRTAIRAVADAIVHDQTPGADAVAALNGHVRRAPRWRELRVGAEPRTEVRSHARAVAAVLSALAEEAADLFAGLFADPARHELRICPGPNCVLYFLRGSTRREWCTPDCGNRARAARHYSKTRQAR
ncbi:CGNR zinc finger domain-containing protein [Dactylosporangium sp. NPDC048998]|uniref:CGNR zinc finger domain-containing protein n=1 Tax=Dactylosporangium sp. NPDC048998 TaxID=3363976 RepID=UPI003715D620